GALEAEQLVVSQQVIEERQELQIELRQRKWPRAVERSARRQRGRVPQQLLVRVDRALVDLLQLADVQPEVVDQHAHQELAGLDAVNVQLRVAADEVQPHAQLAEFVELQHLQRLS